MGKELLKVAGSAVVAYFATPVVKPHVMKALPAAALDSPMAKTGVDVGISVGISLGAYALLGLVFK